MLENYLYKYCSDPVKYLLAQIKSAEENVSYAYYTKLYEVVHAYDADLVLTRIEMYVIRQALKRVAKAIFVKKVYGLKSHEYVASKINQYASGQGRN